MVIVFNGLKRKGNLPDHHNYKELFRDIISEVYWCLAEYQNEKIYTSNIIDIVIVALATAANITIIASI